MGHCFSHLTKADRYKIEALLNNGHSAKEIAAEIHVHISTIYREIKRARMVHRNSDWTEEERYNPDEAHRRYPKGTDFGKVSTAAIKDLEQWINNYPREILGWKTSAMCFRECLDTL